MKKILVIFVVLFAWSIVGQAQTIGYDGYKRIKFSTATLDTIIGPNNNMDPNIYFPMFDQASGTFYDSILVIITVSEIANLDCVRIGFDYSPDNTNWVATYADSVLLFTAAGVAWATAKPPNAGRVAKAIPHPRYGRFTMWGVMNTGATDSTSFDGYTIYGYKKPATLIRVRE